MFKFYSIKCSLLLEAKKVFLLIFYLMCSGIALADSTYIDIYGNIMETPCKIDINSQNISVNFGKINMPRDNAPGIIASKAFSMKLISCPVTQSKVNATISGIADAINPTKSFKNTGTAKNVAIELLSENKDAGPGQVLSGTIVNQEYTFNFIANAVSRGDISPGTINATATVTFTYP